MYQQHSHFSHFTNVKCTNYLLTIFKQLETYYVANIIIL